MSEEMAQAEVQETNLYERIMGMADEDAPVDDGHAEPEAEVAGEEPEVENAAEEGAVEEPEAEKPPTFKVKVGLEEVEVTLDELTNGYQRQADYTRKTQELAAQRRELEEASVRLRQQAMRQPAAVVDNLNDPYLTLEHVHAEMNELDRAYQQALEKDDIFTTQKIQYRMNKLQQRENVAVNRIQELGSLMAGLKVAIPDLDQRAPVLTGFLLESLPDDPLTPQEISYLTDPKILGKTAIKLTKLVNRLYETTQTSRRVAEQKVTKPVPQQTVRPGSTQLSSQPKTTNADILKKKAMADGGEDAWMGWIAAHTKAQKRK